MVRHAQVVWGGGGDLCFLFGSERECELRRVPSKGVGLGREM